MEGVSKRVEMSLSLTAANEIVNWLSKEYSIDAWTLSKMAILVTVCLVCIDSPSEVKEKREGLTKLLGITRQISILAVARSVLPYFYNDTDPDNCVSL